MSTDKPLPRTHCPRCLAVFRGGIEECPRCGSLLEAEEPEPLIGELLGGKYRVVRLAAEGGMGRVYLAVDEDGEEYAVKLLHGELGARLSFRRQLFREAQLAQRIDHPLVVPVLGSGCTRSGLPYLLMPFVKARRLSDLLADGRPMPVREALQIGRQLASALRAVHSHGVIHGDVKPENIFVRGQGSNMQIALFDFGLARCMDLPARGGSGDSDRIVGSPNYLAPELWQQRYVGVQADMYSLGVTLYRMLAGRLPFEQSTVWRILQGSSAPPAPLSRELPFHRMLDEMLAELVAWNPEERPSSMDKLVEKMDWLQLQMAERAARAC